MKRGDILQKRPIIFGKQLVQHDTYECDVSRRQRTTQPRYLFLLRPAHEPNTDENIDETSSERFVTVSRNFHRAN